MRFIQRTHQEGEIKVDLKDRKILYLISKNAKMPYMGIAKEVKLSKDAVKYRIKNMEKNGIIQGYLSVISAEKLGYNSYHIFMQFNQLNREIKSKIIGILRAYPFTRVLIECIGKYDFELGIVAKSIEELDELTTRVIDDVSEYLKEYQILIISKRYVERMFPNKFFVSKDEPELFLTNRSLKKKHKTEFEPDNIDFKLLEVLSKNAKTPLDDLGKLINLSVDAVSYRIKRLMKEGFILKFVPVINYSALGYTTYIILMEIYNLTKEREKTLAAFLRDNENIFWSVKTIGKYNLLVYVGVKNSEDFYQTLIKLREVFSSDIKDYETLIAYEEYKYTYF